MSDQIEGDLKVSIPAFTNFIVRSIHPTTPQQRELVQRKTEYNPFTFPASMLICDFLSDSGASAMTDVQWASLFRSDESYGRNHGYYALQDAVRDVFERGDKAVRLYEKIIVDSPNETWDPIDEVDKFGGFVNSGVWQLKRPTFFITPQGRCAENLLYMTVREALQNYLGRTFKYGEFVIPSNGWFDTTEAHARSNNFQPLNLFSPEFFVPFPADDVGKRNPFKGNMDLVRLEQIIKEKGGDHIPFVLLTITNNTAAGQPVSLANIRAVHALAHAHGIPLVFDAARYAENAYFIHEYEEGYKTKSIPSIVVEMFSHADAFTFSAKKDALCNMGGVLSFRDRGLFHQRYSWLLHHPYQSTTSYSSSSSSSFSPPADTDTSFTIPYPDFLAASSTFKDVDYEGDDVGIRVKEKQILLYGNDSYGGLSGRDIMALTVGLYVTSRLEYLRHRVNQIESLVMKMHGEGIPVILPAGGHAAFLDVNKFFGTTRKEGDFAGVGLTIELIRRFGIRACELGAFAFEWDLKNDEERKGIINLVRFAVPRNVYNEEHIIFTVKAVATLLKDRDHIPNVAVVRGKDLHLRHFQSGLKPIYPGEGEGK